MDLFKLVGTIVINGIENTKEEMESVSRTVQGLKRKVDEYANSGTSVSAAWRRATAELKADTGTAADSMEASFGKIGAAITAFVALDKLKDFGAFCIQTAADFTALESQFQQVFDGMAEGAASSLSAIAESTGINENRMKGSFTQIAAFAQTTGADTEAALSIAERAMIAVADSAAFYDRSLEDVTESLQSFLKGNYENDAALGLSCTETTRNAAANELYGKSFNELSEAQKQLTLLKMVEDANKLSGAMGQAARESDTWTNQTGNLKQAWADFAAMIGEKVLPAAIDLVTKASEIVAWMTEHETAVAVLAVAIGTLTTALIAYNVAQALATSGMTLATVAGVAFGGVMAFITSPITLVIAAIGALVAIGIALYQNWDTIKAAAKDLWTNLKEGFVQLGVNVAGNIEKLKNNISEKWAAIKDAIEEKVASVVASVTSKFQEIVTTIESKMNDVKTEISEIWQSIKGVFSDAVDVGKQLIADIMAGIENGWANLKEWFSGLWDSLFGNLSVGVEVNGSTNGNGGVDGSHASGLDYVPYDGYIAELHKGEMVVPAEEASAVRNGAGSADVANILLMILEAVQEGNNMETVLKLNNREFGRAVRGVVNG